MLVHVEIPGMSLNLQDPLLRLTGIHSRQAGGIPIGKVFTDCARDGGVQPIRLPGSGTGRLGKRELICLLLFTCNYVVSVWRGFLFLWVLAMGYVILNWHSLSLPYNYFGRKLRLSSKC